MLNTELEVLEFVEEKLLAQNAKSFCPIEFEDSGKMGNGCAYRGQEGKKCALGFLIPDDNYDTAFEGEGAHYISWSLVKWKIIPEGANTWKIFAELQHIHDQIPVEEWKEALDSLKKIVRNR